MLSRRRRAAVTRVVRAAFALGIALLLCLLIVDAVAGQSPSPEASAAPSPSPAASSTPAPSIGPLPTPIVHPSDGTSNTCYDCHSAVNDQQKAIAADWKESVHGKAGVGCADCHGGDPRSDSITVAMSTDAGFIGKPDRQQAVAVCGSCHSDPERMRQYQLPTDQYAKYAVSVHGTKLAEGDTRVAICVDCHGSHDVKKASDPTAAVYPFNVPALCASCHADADKMAPYGIPTNQYAIYQTSVHGQALLEKEDLRAPTCASCHGSHDAKPPQSSEVVDVCGKCHTATQALYEQSRHAQLAVGPKCWTCHGTHDVVSTSDARFFHPQPPEIDCATCHDPTDKSLKLGYAQFTSDADRRCDTCHHPDSYEYSQAQAIHDALVGADTAYAEAQARIDEAAGLGMIVSDADVALTEAHTNLIQGRAAVHTTKLTEVAPLTDASVAKSGEAQQVAEAKLAESTFRREAMIVVIGLIILNVLGLMLLRRRLHPATKRIEP